jgi:hypothetical protein
MSALFVEELSPDGHGPSIRMTATSLDALVSAPQLRPDLLRYPSVEKGMTMASSSFEVSHLVAETLQCLESTGVPDDLREVAFGRVFDALASSARPTLNLGAASEIPVATDDALGCIAAKLDVSHESVDRVFFRDGDRLDLVVGPSRIETAKSRATEQIALLIAAGRQAGGIDEDGWTSVDPIREVCENFKRYDPSNFATTIKDMGDLLTVRGTGRDRKVRMTAPAWRRAAELVSNLAGFS